MKTNPGWKFFGLIGLMICAAIAVRAFEPPPPVNEKTAYTLKVHNITRIKGLPDKATEAQVVAQLTGATAYNLKLWQTGATTPISIINGATACKPDKQMHSRWGPPHVQQTVDFATTTGMQSFVSKLQGERRRAKTSRSEENPSPTATPLPSPPAPPPHVQQTAGRQTPEQNKLIADALKR